MTRGSAVFYPIYHAVRAACQMAGAARLGVGGLPVGVAGYAVRQGSGGQAIFANLTKEPQALNLPQDAAIARLDAESWHAATADAGWLDTVERQTGAGLELEPFAIGFAKWGE